MISKILSIENIGKYKSFKIENAKWDGKFKKINIIYANNSSGKTTFSNILKSLKWDNDLINKKKSFSSINDPKIKFISKESKQLNFENGIWNKHLEAIEIFDSSYVDSNIYIIQLIESSANPRISNSNSDFYEKLLGSDNVKLRKDLEDIKSQRSSITLKRKKLSRNIKSGRSNIPIEILEGKLEWMKRKGQQLEENISKIEEKINNLNKIVSYDIYLDKINKYILKFNPLLKITRLVKYGDKLVYSLEVSGHLIRTDEDTHYSLKNTLSEGDKSALALAFFLAKIDLFDDLQNRLIVFDDPISSFDNARRSTTVNELYNIGNKSDQLIILTHDLKFAKDLSNKYNGSCLNLQIAFKNHSSIIDIHDIETDILTGIFKDISVLHNYMELGSMNDIERREVLRCIRPSIEGIFRIKFFGKIENNDWLGDMIRKIRDSVASDSFFSIKIFIRRYIWY